MEYVKCDCRRFCVPTPRRSPFVPLFLVVRLRSWHNATDIDLGTQNPDLCPQQVKMNIVPGTKPLRDKSQEKNRWSILIPSAAPGQPKGAKTQSINGEQIYAPLGWRLYPTRLHSWNRPGARTGTLESPS